MIDKAREADFRLSFHPFQGRPPFGRLKIHPFSPQKEEVVSIPFREDLHSDLDEFMKILEVAKKVSIPFREDLHSDTTVTEDI